MSVRLLKNVFCLLAVLLTTIQLRAQQFATLKDPQPVYRNFSMEQGLPSSETYFVHQDREGYIWICTDRGVARYDGYRFRVFTQKDGLTDDVVFRIYEDYKGRLWFITYNGLLCYWENDRIYPYKYNNRIREYLKNDITTFKCFSIDRNERVLYSASMLGPVAISPSGKMEYLHDKRSGDVITYLMRNGNDWFVSPVTSFGRLTPIVKTDGQKRTVLDKMLASTVANTVTNGKCSFLQMNQWVVSIDSPHLRDSIPALTGVCCDDRYLWQCTSNGAIRTPLAAFGKHRKQDRRFLNGYFVTWVLRDRQGGHWFATLENGVFYTADTEVRTYRKTTAGYSTISDVNGNGKEVFYTDKTGYYRLHPYKAFPSMAARKQVFFLDDRIFFNEQGYNDTLIGHYSLGEIIRLPEINDAFVTADHRLLVVRAWIGRLDRLGKMEVLYYYATDKNPNRQHYLHAVSQDAAGRIYTGNTNGLFELRDYALHIADFRDKRFRVRVSALEYHPAWKNIVATRGIGIYFFDDYRITRQLTEKDGLLDNQINSIFVDRNGTIWAATNKGINRISRNAAGKISVERFTVMHGLPSNEINAIYAYGGKVWAATRKGLAVFYDRVREQRSEGSQLGILEIETDREKVGHPEKWFVVAPGREYVKILLRSTNFRTGKYRSVRYRFAAGGKWLTSTTGELLIPKPASGDYVLEVSCLDENGRWSEVEVLSRFRVDSPFYESWYFIFLLAFPGVAAIYLLFRLRLRQINRRNQLQKTINSLEQKALRAQMNPHFIFNSLNSIQSFLMYDENEKAEKYLLRFARLIRQTLNNSRESYITIEAERETLRGYLELEQMRFKEKFSFAITCSLSADELQWGVPPMLIQPFVENAVLHGFKTMETGGKIEVRFEKLEHQRLLCIVEDNGIGRRATMSAKPEGHKSFGTKITEERLAAFRQKYGDEFSIETIDKEANGAPAGTKVVMHIPVVGPEAINLQEEG